MPESLPLTGYRILVTRSRNQAGEFAEDLEALGAQVTAIPLISISAPDSWAALDAALSQLQNYQWIIFASANSVESCIARLEHLGMDASELNKTKLASIGPATKQVLQAHGLDCQFTPSKFIAEGLIEEFPDFANLRGARILWPRTNIGRNYLLEKLQEAGAIVDVAPSYKTSDPEDKEAVADTLAKLVSESSVDIITFLSAQTCVNFAELLSLGLSRANNINTESADGSNVIEIRHPEGDYSVILSNSEGSPLESCGDPSALKPLRMTGILDNVVIASIGPETSRAALELLDKVDVEANQFTRQGLVQSILDYVKNAPKAVKNH